MTYFNNSHPCCHFDTKIAVVKVKNIKARFFSIQKLVHFMMKESIPSSWKRGVANAKCALVSGESHSCWFLLPSPAQFYCCSHYLLLNLLTLAPVHHNWQIEKLQDIIVSVVTPVMSKLAQSAWLLIMFPAMLTNTLADRWTLQNTQVVTSPLLEHFAEKVRHVLSYSTRFSCATFSLVGC